jgi:hypothetical protein
MFELFFTEGKCGGNKKRVVKAGKGAKEINERNLLHGVKLLMEKYYL